MPNRNKEAWDKRDLLIKRRTVMSWEIADRPSNWISCLVSVITLYNILGQCRKQKLPANKNDFSVFNYLLLEYWKFAQIKCELVFCIFKQEFRYNFKNIYPLALVFYETIPWRRYLLIIIQKILFLLERMSFKLHESE